MLSYILNKKLGLYGSSFFLFFCCFFISVRAFSLPVSRVSLKSQLSSNITQSLEQMMLMMGQVHETVKSNNKDQFKQKINQLIEELNRVQVFNERELAYHEKSYLHRQIQQMKEYLNIIAFNKEDMKNNLFQLKNLNRELIYISHAYNLKQQKTQYGFYFCPKDDSVWIQKSNIKVYHPFKENYRNCGRKIH